MTREVRVAVSDLATGDYVVRVGQREVGRRLRRVLDVPAGTPIRGPRGGRYRLTAVGARDYLQLDLDGGSPLVRRTAVVTVLRDTGEDCET